MDSGTPNKLLRDADAAGAMSAGRDEIFHEQGHTERKDPGVARLCVLLSGHQSLLRWRSRLGAIVTNATKHGPRPTLHHLTRAQFLVQAM